MLISEGKLFFNKAHQKRKTKQANAHYS